MDKEKPSWVDDRRNFLLAVAAGTAVNVIATLNSVIGNIVSRHLKNSQNHAAAINAQKTAEANRISNLTRLFGLHDSMLHLHCANNHPAPSSNPTLAKGVGYPHDYTALEGFISLYPGSFSLVEGPFEAKLSNFDSIVASGSPIANPCARTYLPCHGTDDFAADMRKYLLTNPDDIPYHMISGGEDAITVVSAMRGQPKRSRRNGILYRDPQNQTKRLQWFPSDNVIADSAGRLARDFLLLSKFPRISEKGELSGGAVFVIAGAHGAGTQAMELLFFKSADDKQGLDARVLETLANTISTPYYQIVFEVDDIVHKPFTYGRSIRVSRDLPPVSIHPSSNFVTRTPDEALQETLREA